MLLGTITLLVVLGALFEGVPLSGAAVGPIEQAIETLNVVPRLYERYPIAIDFLLAFLLFMALAYKVFENRPIALALGLALAFSVALLEQRTGVSLGQFSFYAVVVIAGMLLYLLYHLCRGFGLGFKPSLGIALVVVLLTLLSYGSGALSREVLGLLYLVLLILLVSWGASFLHNRIALREPLPELAEQYPALREEKRLLGTYIASLAWRARKDLHSLKNEILALLEMLAKFGKTERGREAITQTIGKLLDREHPLEVELRRLNESVARVEAQDVRAARGLSGQGRRRVRGEETRKLVDAQQVRGLESAAEEHVARFTGALQNAARSCDAGDAERAEVSLREGLKTISEAERLMERVRMLLAAMEAETGREMKKAKRARRR
mgnify:CR=1 FL=1